MPQPLDYASPDQPGGRPLPAWAWLLALLFFPPGLFIAQGAARLLSWTASILLAITSYASLAILAGGMAYADSHTRSAPLKALASLLGIGFFFAWAFTAYHVGRRAHYWTRPTRRAWHIVFWLLASLALFGLLATSLLWYLQYRAP